MEIKEIKKNPDYYLIRYETDKNIVEVRYTDAKVDRSFFITTNGYDAEDIDRKNKIIAVSKNNICYGINTLYFLFDDQTYVTKEISIPLPFIEEGRRLNSVNNGNIVFTFNTPLNIETLIQFRLKCFPLLSKSDNDQNIKKLIDYYMLDYKNEIDFRLKDYATKEYNDVKIINKDNQIFINSSIDYNNEDEYLYGCLYIDEFYKVFLISLLSVPFLLTKDYKYEIVLNTLDYNKSK